MSSDLKAGFSGWGVVKIVLYWLAGIGVFGAGVVGYSLIESDTPVTETPSELGMIFQDRLPVDFFRAPDESTPEAVIKPVPKVEPLPVVPPVPQPVIQYVYIEKPVPVQAKADDWFERETERPVNISEAINQQRRQFSTAPVDLPTADGPLDSSSPNASTSAAVEAVKPYQDADWTEYGQNKTQASFPVDLSRVITADRNIPCILVESINSELAGKITCVVENNIYGAQGRFVLLPAGSKAIGEYFPLARTGDTRIVSTWHRVITPAGINITFPNKSAAMTDAMGRAGITGDVDNQYFDKYGIAVLVATLNTALTVSIPVETASQQAVVQSYSAELGRVSSAILQDNIDISPIVTIDAGSRVFITPTEDIWFKGTTGREREVISAQGGNRG